MITIPSALEHLQYGSTQRITVLYRLTRVDGVVKYLTEHDVEIDFESQTYTPSGLADASARRWQAGMKEASFDARGIIDDVDITDDDLHAGRYDNCKVEEIIVDWRYPWAGSIISVFWIDSITRDGEVWSAELSGPTRWTRRKIGEVITRNCENDLGDSLCGVNIASFTRSGVVVEGMEDGPKQLIIIATTSVGVFSDNYFAGGYVSFLTGQNAGLQENVKSYRASDRRIELQGPLPFAVSVGDTFDIVAGCNGLYSTCDGKFSNKNRFRGFLFMPGIDRLLRTPSRKS